MADIDVKKDETRSAEQTEGRFLQRRRSNLFDSPSIASPAAFGDPFAFMRRMQEDMDRRMAQVFGGDGGTWNPAIEISQRGGQFKICAELPGLDPQDVTVEITDDGLVIQGERRSEHEDKSGGMYRTERQYGRFYRNISLPEGALADQARAEFRNGVLEVTVPIPEQKSGRRVIPVQGESRMQSESPRSEQERQ